MLNSSVLKISQTFESNKGSTLRRWLSVAAISSMVTLFSFSAHAKEIEKSFDVAKGGELKIKTDVGSIDVSTHSSSTIDVQVEIEGYDSDEFEVNFNHKGDSLIIEGDKLKRNSGWGSRKIAFEIVVPESYNLDLNTSGGSIRVTDLTGKVDTHTSGGSLHFGHINGDIKGHTSGGSINVDGAEGEVDIHTSGGSINVGDVKGNLKGRTSGGSITLGKISGEADVKTSGGSIDIKEVGGAIIGKTSGGSINVTISKQPSGPTELHTSGGSVTAYLADNIAVDLDARGKKIKSDFEVDGQTKAKRKLQGEINGGGPELSLKTSSGNVYIKKK